MKGDGGPDRGGDRNAVHQDKSPPLRTIPPAAWPHPGEKRAHQEHPIPHSTFPSGPDPVVQTAGPTRAAPTAGTSFPGLGDGFSGPAGTMSVNCDPAGRQRRRRPEPLRAGRQRRASPSSASPAPCSTARCRPTRSGAASAAAARRTTTATRPSRTTGSSNRWVISQFSVSTTPYLSASPSRPARDPTGSYYRYSFPYGTTSPTTRSSASGRTRTTSRSTMFAGRQQLRSGPRSARTTGRRCSPASAATQQCFSARRNELRPDCCPSDLDGATPPPAGAPNYLARAPARTLLHLWKFHVDWATPANSTLTGPDEHLRRRRSRPLAPRAARASRSRGRPEARCARRPPDVPARLSQLRRPRVAGRRPHSVAAGSSVGMRWYEIRDPDGDADGLPAGHVRARLALPLDGQRRDGPGGDIALGYSASSSTLFPSIRYTGRLAGDPLGQMTPGRGHAHRRRRARRPTHSPLGRLHEHERRPHRRLHVLVHEPVHPVERGVQLADADRVVPASRAAAGRRPTTSRSAQARRPSASPRARARLRRSARR